MNHYERAGMTLQQAKRHLHLEGKAFPEHMVEVPKEKWPFAPAELKAVWRSRYFMAQVFDEGKGAIRISVCRAQIGDDGRWLDGIAWDELQQIKAQMGFGNQTAVEIYPPDADVVNVANMRHLWILAEALPFQWRAKQ